MSETSVSDLQALLAERIVSGVAKDMVAALVQEAIENGGEISLDSVKSRWEEKALARDRLNEAAPALLAALEDLVRINVQHNEAVEKVIGTQVGWKDNYLDAARAAIAQVRGES